MIETGLRLPEQLHALLVAWAQDEGRSLNSQIVYLLKKAADNKTTKEGE